MSDVTKLINGFKEFQQQYFGSNQELAKQLEKGQMPQTLLIGCCDSRVDPALLTSCDPGDLFMLRNIANLVPPYHASDDLHGVSSALEYAVCVLEVTNIIILGHSKCGGIAGLMSSDEEKPLGEFIGNWVNIAAHAKQKVLQDLPNESAEVQAQACEKEAILVSLKNLMTFPWVRERVAEGKLALHGWYYDIVSGRVKYYNQVTQTYEVLVEPFLSSAKDEGE